MLQTNDDDVEQETNDSLCSGSDNDQEDDQISINPDDENQLGSDNTESDDDEAIDHDVVTEDENDSSFDYETGVDDADDVEDDLEDGEDESDEDDGEISEHGDDDPHTFSHDGSVETKATLKDSAKKRKFSDFNAQLTAADTSLRALKKLAGTTTENVLPENEDGILSNADFQRIRELKVCSSLIQQSSISNFCKLLSF